MSENSQSGSGYSLGSPLPNLTDEDWAYFNSNVDTSPGQQAQQFGSASSFGAEGPAQAVPWHSGHGLDALPDLQEGESQEVQYLEPAFPRLYEPLESEYDSNVVPDLSMGEHFNADVLNHPAQGSQVLPDDDYNFGEGVPSFGQGSHNGDDWDPLSLDQDLAPQAQHDFDNGFESQQPPDNATSYIYNKSQGADMPRDYQDIANGDSMGLPSSSFSTSPNRSSSILQGYGYSPESANTTVDSAILSIGQPNASDDFFQAPPISSNSHLESGSPLPDPDHSTFAPADDEGDLFDEENAAAEVGDEEVEDINVDSGEFVVADASKVTNIEKAGTIRGDGASLEWQDKTGLWHPAVIHHNIRATLIAEAQAQHPGLSYDYPDKVGPGPHDVTAFHLDSQSWGPAREHRPRILYTFDQPGVRNARPRPGPMRYQGRVVLNQQNNPVLDWPIPATLSSKTSGYKMEAWKRSLGLTQEDLRARMVRFTLRYDHGTATRVPLPDKNVVINMAMQRFRDRAGCIAWSRRNQSVALREGIIGLMRSEGVDPTVTNSTELFGRDLTEVEQKEVKKGDKGRFPVAAVHASSAASSSKPSHKRAREEHPTPTAEERVVKKRKTRGTKISMNQFFSLGQPQQDLPPLTGLEDDVEEGSALPDAVLGEHTPESSFAAAARVDIGGSREDCRTLVPRSESQRQSIDDALKATRQAYFEWAGYEAPQTDRSTSYLSQWQHIRAAFEGFYWGGEEVPYIPQLPPWYTTLEDWPAHEKDFMYFEAWVYGHRAPRLNGVLIKGQKRWAQFLERISWLDDRDRQVQLDGYLAVKGFVPE